jgi:hypothetical protein
MPFINDTATSILELLPDYVDVFSIFCNSVYTLTICLTYVGIVALVIGYFFLLIILFNDDMCIVFHKLFIFYGALLYCFIAFNFLSNIDLDYDKLLVSFTSLLSFDISMTDIFNDAWALPTSQVLNVSPIKITNDSSSSAQEYVPWDMTNNMLKAQLILKTMWEHSEQHHPLLYEYIGKEFKVFLAPFNNTTSTSIPTNVLDNCPEFPLVSPDYSVINKNGGVYCFTIEGGKTIYTGSASRLVNRVDSHISNFDTRANAKLYRSITALGGIEKVTFKLPLTMPNMVDHYKEYAMQNGLEASPQELVIVKAFYSFKLGAYEQAFIKYFNPSINTLDVQFNFVSWDPSSPVLPNKNTVSVNLYGVDGVLLGKYDKLDDVSTATGVTASTIKYNLNFYKFTEAPGLDSLWVRFESPELMAKQQEMVIKGVNRDTLPRGISVLNKSKQLLGTYPKLAMVVAAFKVHFLLIMNNLNLEKMAPAIYKDAPTSVYFVTSTGYSLFATKNVLVIDLLNKHYKFYLSQADAEKDLGKSTLYSKQNSRFSITTNLKKAAGLTHVKKFLP